MKAFVNTVLFVGTLMSILPSLEAQTAVSPPPSPEEVRNVNKQLVETSWSYHNPNSIEQVAGKNILQAGSWTELRFRSDGRLTAWHYDELSLEGHWEVLGPRLVRIYPFDKAGLVLLFNDSFTAYTVENRKPASGKRVGRAPWLPAIVGKWRSKNGVVVSYREDGRVFAPAGNGTWKALAGDKFEVVWRGGAFTDAVRVMSGGDKIKCKCRENGHESFAERVKENDK